MKNEVLTIKVVIEDSFQVAAGDSLARMITFSGNCECENFNGIILNGGVDTQQIRNGGQLSLSARYILRGVDKCGQECSIFIENNGIAADDIIRTKPQIITDSEYLSFLNDANLEGTVESWENGVIIHIFI